jgi:hypothetical protein
MLLLYKFFTFPKTMKIQMNLLIYDVNLRKNKNIFGQIPYPAIQYFVILNRFLLLHEVCWMFCMRKNGF